VCNSELKVIVDRQEALVNGLGMTAFWRPGKNAIG